MTETKGIDLLLTLLQRDLKVVTYPEIFLNGIILIRWNMYRMASAITETLRNHNSVTLACLDTLSLLGQHRCWNKNDAFDPD